MDPISLSLAITPLVISSEKLMATVGSIRHLYKHAETAVTSTYVECDLMHVALCEVPGLVQKNRTELAVHLRSQQSLQETFDKVLTGCRITLDALKLELDDLLKLPKGKVSRSGDMDFQSKAQYIWKKEMMEELMGQMRSQRDYNQFHSVTILFHLCRLAYLSSSRTQAEILILIQKNAISVQKLLNRARFRSLQGFDDTQSSFTPVAIMIQDPFKNSFEEQLHESPAYRKAQAAAEEELLAAKLELLEEKYNLGTAETLKLSPLLVVLLTECVQRKLWTVFAQRSL